MDIVKRISSKRKDRYINIVKKGQSYTFELHVIEYDDEEECTYILREYPDPQGIYGDLESASKEAERLIDL